MKRLTVTPSPLEARLGWFYWFFQLLILPVALALLNDYFHNPLTETELNFLYFCANVVCPVLLLHKFIFSSFLNGLRRPWRTLRCAFGGFLLYWLASSVISWGIVSFYPDFANANDASIAQMLQENDLLTTIGTVLLAPIGEEILFRGVIFGSLYRKNKAVAYLVSVVIFAAVHLVGYLTVYDPILLLCCFLQYVPAGLFLARAFVRSDSLLAPILIHMTVNQIAISALR